MPNLAARIGLSGSWFDPANLLAGYLRTTFAKVLPRDFSGPR